jgi:uncharacterized protein (TIGR02271 family)
MYEQDPPRRRAKPRVRPAGQTAHLGTTADTPESVPAATTYERAARLPAGVAGADTRAQAHADIDALALQERTIELREEELVAHKDFREAGEVRIRTTIEEVPTRLEVEARREEVEVEHVPMGQVVTERLEPWEEDGVLTVPVYEEQLVVVKRLVLREHLRIRRVGTVERQLFQDTLRQERLVIEDPNNSHLVHERYPDGDADDGHPDDRRRENSKADDEGGILGQLVRKALG